MIYQYVCYLCIGYVTRQIKNFNLFRYERKTI